MMQPLNNHGAPHVLVLGTGFGFPYGGGATTRVLAYAHGMRRHGAHVQIVCARPSDHPAKPRNTERSGIFEGIPFAYTTTPIQPSNGPAWHTANLIALLRAVPAVRRLARQRPVDAILFYGMEEPLSLLVAHRLSRSLGAKLLLEMCEYPFYARTDPSARLMNAYARRRGYRLVDGVIPISRYLEELVRPYLRPDARTLRVPILVNVARFPEPSRRPETGGTVAYLGDFGHPGEVNALVEAFARIGADFPAWRLRLLGGTAVPGILEGIRANLERLGLTDRTEMPGPVRREEIPEQLAAADVMALPRASGAFSRAGFPTKLGEYLATGKPVVVTATGDIPDYLTDGEDAYLVPPDDAEAFAGRLRHVLGHPEEAEAVGLCGRASALRLFDAYRHGRRILDFIDELHGRTPSAERPASSAV